MNPNRYIQLIYKQLKGDISPEEAKDLQDWEGKSEENQAEAKLTRDAWEASAEHDLPFDLDLDADFAAIQGRIQTTNKQAKVVKMPVRRPYLRIAAAGAVLVAAVFLLRNFMSQAETMQTFTAQKAGEKISLVDGTEVTLNAGSTLSYPTDFSESVREVKLTGEAYFSVTKNAAKRFEVHTDKTTVTVLGTEFNVSENSETGLTEIAVSEGKVQVEANESKDKIILTAAEKGVFNHKEAKLSEYKDANLNDLAWKRGVLQFKATKLSEVLSELGDFYEVEIALEEENMKNCAFSGRYKTSTTEREMIDIIAGFYNFTIEEKTQNEILLKGGKCK